MIPMMMMTMIMIARIHGESEVLSHHDAINRTKWIRKHFLFCRSLMSVARQRALSTGEV